MIADQDAVKLVRRAILEHIRELVEDLVHWANELDHLEAPQDASRLLDSLFASDVDTQDSAESEGGEAAVAGRSLHAAARQLD